MTHPSCTGPCIRASLDRLEFLGDAILDYIVVTKLFSYSEPKLENSTLHLLRTALVNADILAFLVMEWSIPLESVDVDVDGTPSNSDSNSISDTVDLKTSQASLPLWSFMRHASPDMGAIQRATSLRHAAMCQQIHDALWKGERYPWSLLCRLQAQKFYSDVLEALLGAVWVDSGSIQACERIVEGLGIFPLMERLLRDGVWLLHPKEELGQLACSEKVVYDVEAVVQSDDDGLLTGGGNHGGDGTAERVLFVCTVSVGGECVGTSPQGAYSREEARTSAAEVACRVLKERMSEKGGGNLDN
jgi:dsRNA-specific ribonuclease